MAEVVKHGIISDPELFELCARGLGWVKDNLEDNCQTRDGGEDQGD